MNNCDKTSNNKYFDCPARMDDGRAFTDYRPSSSVNDMIRYSNNVMTSFDYRQFLTHNATKIMEVNNVYTKEKVGCPSCNYVEVPFQNTCTWNTSYGSCAMTNQNGIGIANKVMSQNIENFTPNGENLTGYNINGNSSLTGQMAFDYSAQNIPVKEQYKNYGNENVSSEQIFNAFEKNVPVKEQFNYNKRDNIMTGAQGAYNEFKKNVFVPEAFSMKR